MGEWMTKMLPAAHRELYKRRSGFPRLAPVCLVAVRDGSLNAQLRSQPGVSASSSLTPMTDWCRAELTLPGVMNSIAYSLMPKICTKLRNGSVNSGNRDQTQVFANRVSNRFEKSQPMVVR